MKRVVLWVTDGVGMFAWGVMVCSGVSGEVARSYLEATVRPKIESFFS